MEKSEKIIFLDIDGVLNTSRHQLYLRDNGAPTRDEYGQLFDPHCVSVLGRIVEKTGAKLVISSTWRKSGLTEMKRLWEHRGLPGEVIGCTPSIYVEEVGYCLRGIEILAWLQEHVDGGHWSDYERYVIIDDDSDMLYWQRGHFYKTNPDVGLEAWQALDIVAKLNA